MAIKFKIFSQNNFEKLIALPVVYHLMTILSYSHTVLITLKHNTFDNRMILSGLLVNFQAAIKSIENYALAKVLTDTICKKLILFQHRKEYYLGY